MALDGLQDQKSAISISFTNLSQNEEENLVSHSKISREQRMAKRLPTLHPLMYFIGLHIDIAKEAISFYNNILLFAYLFSSKFVSASWFTIPSITSWIANEVILYQKRPIRH